MKTINYLSPTIELIDAMVEKGFAQSYGDPGYVPGLEDPIDGLPIF